jgi:Xaa-Pro aminopeptidase
MEVSMTIRPATLKISKEEHLKRCVRLLEAIASENFAAVVLFDATYILYYTGFAFIPTERPIALVIDADGKMTLFVPRLELEHANTASLIDEVEYYPEYPGDPHPMEKLKSLLSDMGLGASLAADDDGYPRILGYQGPSLSQVTGVTVYSVRRLVEEQLMLKSPAEVALIRESVRWGNLAHQLLQRYTYVGGTETEVSQRASDEATRAMLDAIGPIYKAQSPFSRGASAGYRGQIGRNAAIPHAMAANIIFQPGDVLVTGAGAPVWGYNSELERTMIIGDPSEEQRSYFKHMVNLQDIALAAIRPGIPCSEVDTEVRAYYQDHNLMDLWKHHTGHAIGLRYHEGPFLDAGDHTVIKPGMVFTVEPGLYIPGLGGFRHSDTALVTEDGIEILTYYPRDLESLTIPG